MKFTSTPLIGLGVLTPSMESSRFAIPSIANERSLGAIAKTLVRYMLMFLAFAFLLYAFPDIASWLPTIMKAG